MALVRGRTLLTLRKRMVGIVLGLVAATLLPVGAYLAARGIELGFPPPMHWIAAGILAVVGLGATWIAGSLLTERLVVTDEGVFHLQGRGLFLRTVLVDEARWDPITTAKLVVGSSSSRGQTTKSYTLVFERRDDSTLSYLIGVPSYRALMRLSRICEERGIRAHFS